MKRKVVLPNSTTQTATLTEAANALKNKKIVFYKTDSEGIIAILAKLTVHESKQVSYGFIYVGRDAVPKYVCANPYSSIQMAVMQGAHVMVIDSLEELP